MGKMHFNHDNHHKVKKSHELGPVPTSPLKQHLVEFKEQQLLDRKRRLQLIRRIKREQDKYNKSLLKLKLALGVSLTMSLIALLWH